MDASKKATPWLIGTVLLVVLLLAGGFLLVVNPVLTEASETHVEAIAAEDANTALSAKIVTLKKQYAEIDTYKAELAGLRTQIPSTADTANLLRGLQSAATATGITLVSLTPGTASEVTAATTTESTLSGAGVTDSQSAESDSASADGSTSGTSTTTTAATTGLVAISLAVDLVGTYANALEFLTAIQSTTGRSYFVTSIDVSSQPDAEASGGRPATSVGDAEMQLNGYIFVLPESAVAASDPTATAAPLPGAVAGKNPLVPVAG